MPAQKGIDELEAELSAIRASLENEIEEDNELKVVEPPKQTEDNFGINKKEKKPEENASDDGVDWKKRHGDLRRHSQKTENELKQKLQEALDQINDFKTKPNTQPPTNPEEVKAWVEKFPQVASIIRALAEEKAQELYGNEIQSIKKDSAESKKSKELARIYKAHEDFDEIKEDDAFHDWIEAQPEFVQDFVFKGNADQVIYALNLYKSNKQPKYNNDKEAARTLPKGSTVDVTTSDGKRKFYESEVEEMTAREYEKFEEEIQTAIREGRFVYDLSGAAR